MNLPPLKTIIANLALLVTSLIVVLGVMEAALIFISDTEDNDYAFTRKFFEQYVRYNKHGYRDYEYALEKPDGTFRILVLGDSNTFGHGIPELKNTWVKQLESKLRKKGTRSNIEVLNISKPGWNTDTQLYELFEKGFNFNPDLVILAYYHNDIPAPTGFNCHGADYTIIPTSGILEKSRIAGLFNFRMNRLLENIGRKPSYADCLNQLYESLGWEMEKFYLNIMGIALFIKRIHFMIIAIPLIHQLDDSYPLAGPHQKLKEFSNQRNVEFLDLYEKGFKNLDASQLRLSKTDHHLNQRAGDIVASILFNRIKSLTKYKNLSYFSKAFSLKEILNEYPLLEKLDNQLNKPNSNPNFILNSENEVLQVIRDSGRLIIKKIQKESNGTNPVSQLNTILDSSGNLIRQEKVSFYPNSRIPQTRETTIRHSDMYTHTIERIKPDPKGALTAFQMGQRTYQFDFEGDGNYKRIKLEKDIAFPDPKVLDRWIFDNIHPPSEKHSRENQKEILIGMITKNPNIFDTPDDSQIIEKTGYLDGLSSENLARNFDERVLFQTFLILDRYGAKNYVNLLLELIEQHKPSFMAVNAANRYRSHIQRSIRKLP